jgi:hypothetical protein
MATKFKSSVEVDGYLSISSGNWIQVPDGTTAQRPGSPTVGMFRYNTTTNEFEGYFGSPAAWGAIGGGGGSGTVTEAFKTFAVSGQASIVADGPTDTLTVAAGSNISLTTDASTDTLTIASTGGSGGGTVTIQRNNYTGDGSTVAYGVSSQIISENNIQIYLDGVYQDKDGFTTAGSTVTFGTAPPATTEIEIMHYVAVDGVIEVDEFVGDGTTTAFATSLSIINEDATQVYVSGVYQSKLTYGTTGNVVSFITAPPNGANIEIVHIKALALSGFNKNNFVGTGSQTAFTLNTTVNEENMTFVFLEGIYQDKSTYGISGSTLTFATAPQNGYNVEVMVLGAISASTNALYTDTFTGDGSQTAYALGITPVDLNAIEVYLNGLYQNVSTLTLAANVVTFATSPPSGVIIEIRSVGFLNSGGTLAPATLTGGTGISVVTNSPNNFTISNTLVDVTVSFNTVTGQSLTYTAVSPISSIGQAGSVFPTTTFTVTDASRILSGTAVITGLPAGITSTQSYNNTGVGNILTITLSGVYPSTNSIGTNLVISGLTITAAPLTVDYLVSAGGGGGASGYGGIGGGAGGAGGLRSSYGNVSGTPAWVNETTSPLNTGTNYTVTVGAGGGGAPHGSGGTAVSGSNSVFNNITSIGGGGAKSYQDSSAAGSSLSGGSGGGGSWSSITPGAAVTSPVTHGYAGGAGTTAGGSYGGGGGGGAGSAGGNANSSNGGSGGNGLQVNIDGNNYYYGGGGGGGNYSGTGASGGSGVGGNGGTGSSSPGSAATVNRGSGGGGGVGHPNTGVGGAGSSGVVILRYPSSYTITIGSGLTGTTSTAAGGVKITTFSNAGGTGNIQFN